MTFPVTLLPPPARYRPVGAQWHPKRDLEAIYSHFQVTSSQMTSLSVTSGRGKSRDVISVTRLPLIASYSPVRAQMYLELDL